MSDMMDDMEGGEGVVKKFMFVNRKAPHGTIYALEGLEVVLISAAFDQDVSMVFVDDGVYESRGQHQGYRQSRISPRPTARLEGYDIENCMSKGVMDARGLTEDDLIVDVTVLDSAEMANLMAEQDVVISY
jgi:tRNA 2-thiouridine synthesizing protein C